VDHLRPGFHNGGAKIGDAWSQGSPRVNRLEFPALLGHMRIGQEILDQGVACVWPVSGEGNELVRSLSNRPV